MHTGNNTGSNSATRKARLGKIETSAWILVQPSLAKQSRFSHSDLLTSGQGDGPLPAVSASLRADPGVHVCSPPTAGCLSPVSHFPIIGSWQAPEPGHDDSMSYWGSALAFCQQLMLFGRNQSFWWGSWNYGELH